METAIKQVADDILKKKTNSELKHLVYLFGVIIIVLSGAIFTSKITSAANKAKAIESSINVVSQDIQNLGIIVKTGFEKQDKKIDSSIVVNQLQHNGLNKKMEIWKDTQDKNIRKQFDLIDDLINVNELKPIGRMYIPPIINEAEIINSIELKYDQNNNLSNEIYNEVAKNQISHDNH